MMPADEPRTGEERKAARETTAALEAALAQIESPEDAGRTLDELERMAGNAIPTDELHPPDSPAAKARAIARAAGGVPNAAKVLEEIARQVTRQEPAEDPVVDQAVETAAGHSAETDARPAPAATRHGRRLLREVLVRRLHPLDALDSKVYLAINHLPHPRWADRAMKRLTWVMTGGHGWLAVLAAIALFRPKAAGHAALCTLPALWLTTAAVEYPIKNYCRRKRPFISVVRAIVVGRKPGSYSFPSGHSAAAFAGAVLLGRCFPRLAPAFFGLAGLTAFSRVYLGAHFPGDVLCGSLIGAGLSGFLQRRLTRRTALPCGTAR